MTELRQLMTQELRLRNFAENSISSYIRAVRQYAKYFGKSPEQLAPRGEVVFDSPRPLAQNF